MKRSHRILLSAFFLIGSQTAHADAYKCSKMVYKDGWLKKYEYKGNTWGANTKKNGVFSSTMGATTETTTASVDPGVTSKKLLSTSQYSSSWGECAAIDYHIAQEFRTKYIQQNLAEIKKQIAVGDGEHIASLAFLSGCQQLDRSMWVQSLQNNMESFYDSQNEAQFDHRLQGMIMNDQTFTAQCRPLG